MAQAEACGGRPCKHQTPHAEACATYPRIRLDPVEVYELLLRLNFLILMVEQML